MTQVRTVAEGGITRLVRLLADMSCNVVAWCLSGTGGFGVSDMLLGIRLMAARRTQDAPRHGDTKQGR